MNSQQATDDMHAAMRRLLSMLGGKLALTIIGLGGLAVGLATNGAASVPIVAAQMPYLVSGLGIGLGLILFGCALMIVQSAREDRARLETRLEQLIFAVQASGQPVDAPAVSLQGLVVAGQASYHTPECRLVEGREQTLYFTPQEARARMLQPCRVCQPDSAAAGRAAANGHGDHPTTVLVP